MRPQHVMFAGKDPLLERLASTCHRCSVINRNCDECENLTGCRRVWDTKVVPASFHGKLEGRFDFIQRRLAQQLIYPPVLQGIDDSNAIS